MIIVLKPGISKTDERAVLAEIRKLGYTPHVMRGVARTVVGAIGDELTHANLETLTAQFPKQVESVMPIQKRYKLVSREAHPANSTVRVREHTLGGKKFHVPGSHGTPSTSISPGKRCRSLSMTACMRSDY